MKRKLYFQESKKKIVKNADSFVQIIFWLLIWKYICYEKEIYFQESKKIVEMFFQILS